MSSLLIFGDRRERMLVEEKEGKGVSVFSSFTRLRRGGGEG